MIHFTILYTIITLLAIWMYFISYLAKKQDLYMNKMNDITLLAVFKVLSDKQKEKLGKELNGVKK